MSIYVVHRADPLRGYEVVSWDRATKVAVLRGRYSTFPNTGFDPVALKDEWTLTDQKPAHL